jgi:hypothetical protein
MKVLPILIVFFTTALLGWWASPRKAVNSGDPRTSLSTRNPAQAARSDDPMRQLRDLGKSGTYEEKVRRVIALASSVPLDEIAGWHKKSLTAFSNPRLAELFIGITAERWLEAAPREMMDWAILTMGENESNPYLAKWALQDPESATDFILKLPEHQRDARMEGLIANLLTNDPKLAFEIAKKHMAIERVGSGISQYGLARRLASLDLEATLAMREDWSPELREATNSQIAAAFLEQDFSGGMKFLESENLTWRTLYDAMRGGGEVSRLCLEHAQGLPEGWLEKMMLESSSEWGRGFGEIAWIEADPKALGVSKETFTRYLENAIYFTEGETRKPRLMEIVNGDHLGPELRERFLRNQVLKWPVDDAVGLQNWLGKLQDETLFDSADKALAEREEQQKPPPSAQERDMAPVRTLREIAAGTAGEHFFLGGYWSPAAIQQVEQTFHDFSPTEKTALYERFGETRVRNTAPYGLASLIMAEAVATYPPGTAGRPEKLMAQLGSFVSEWAYGGPAQAGEWVSNLPDGPDKITAAREVAKAWQAHAPEEARAWVNQFPSKQRDGILEK